MNNVAKTGCSILTTALTAIFMSCGDVNKDKKVNEANNLNRTLTTSPQKGSDYRVQDVGMEFVWIKSLNMWGGKYEVTNGEYRKFRPKHDSKKYNGHSLNGERQPAVFVNFDDAQEYAEWLTDREKEAGRLPAGYGYRLPTKNEWTVLCQCGDNRKYPWGEKWPPQSGHAGNYHGSSGAGEWNKIPGYDDGFAVTCPVEKSWANKWGICGLGGNVWECTRKSADDSSFDSWCGQSWVSFLDSTMACSYGKDFGASSRNISQGFRLVLYPVGVHRVPNTEK